jgi:hypothetical protein
MSDEDLYNTIPNPVEQNPGARRRHVASSRVAGPVGNTDRGISEC